MIRVVLPCLAARQATYKVRVYVTLMKLFISRILMTSGVFKLRAELEMGLYLAGKIAEKSSPQATPVGR